MLKRRTVLCAKAFLAAIVLAASATFPAGNARAADELQITTLSSHPDTVSGGSVLVAVRAPDGRPLEDVRISLNGAVADAVTHSLPAGLMALVKNLSMGANTLEVRATAGQRPLSGQLTLIDHASSGPIFSGPHQTPWICETGQFKLPDGSTLGPPKDENCDAPTKILYLYMPKGGSAFRPLPSTGSWPHDLGFATTTDGRTVPYVVRLETGTIDRGIYQFAMLFNPMTEKAPDPFGTYKGWNRKIIFAFGGSASAGYIQGTSTGGVLNPVMLSRGFAVISSSLNVLGNNENDVLTAEAASMTKERFIESFGVPLYTMGWGASGGAMQQHLIANNYPGILDGIIPWASFPDTLSVAYPAQDCVLLAHAFRTSSVRWTFAQKTAVSGFASFSSCNGKVVITPSIVRASYSSLSLGMAKRVVAEGSVNGSTIDLSNCLSAVPVKLTYDPVSNPTGARCDFFDSERNELGIDPVTGFAGWAWDNVGVQYGLDAFRSGAISAEQFVQLNARIGGYDRDGNFQSARTSASLAAIAAAYSGGRVNGMRNLADIPIIDVRSYSETPPGYDVHNSIWSMVSRARLMKATGSASNQVILRFAPGMSGFEEHAADILSSMDRWLMNISNDKAHYSSVAQKVVHDKPAGLVDACYTESGERIAEPADIHNRGKCEALYPFHRNPRLVAGEPLTMDTLKCRLRPLHRSDYRKLSDSQYARLKAVFPSGVCDYSVAGAGFAPLKGTWLSYPKPGLIEVPH